MAEFVQQSIEQMLPELEEMVRIRLFTQHETRAMLKQRKAHEYRLKRRTKDKDDYLQYVQYEINVLALVRKRRDKYNVQHKKVEIDLAIVQRIHSLFRMACHRFQNDLNLWLSHIEFAKKRGEKSTTSRLMLRMLQVHTRKPELWIMAAKWEFEMNKSSENSRALFQRGLRFNPESRELWLEYYRMELLNVEKLKKRRKVLGLEDMETEEETITQTDAVLEGKIAELVFTKAIDAFPDDLDFCLSFVNVCGVFDFGQSMGDGMMEIVKNRFGEREEYWNAISMRHGGGFVTEKTVGLKAVVELESNKANILKKACDDLKTEKMWTLYIGFWLNRVGKKASKELRSFRVQNCMESFSNAEEVNLLSIDMKIERIKFVSKFGDNPNEVKQLCKQASEEHPENVELRLVRIQMLILAQHPKDAIVDIFKRSIPKIKVEDSLPLWETVIAWLVEENHARHLIPLLELGLKSKSDAVVRLCKSTYLTHTLKNEGIKSVRKLVAQFSSILPRDKDFMSQYLTMEMAEKRPKMKTIRSVFDEYLDSFGRGDVDTWLWYIAFERSHQQQQASGAGDATRVSDIHWKAMRTLESSLAEEFVQKYTLLNATPSAS